MAHAAEEDLDERSAYIDEPPKCYDETAAHQDPNPWIGLPELS